MMYLGIIPQSTGSSDNPYRYAGYCYDGETGLYYLNARFYDPVTAQFLQEDTYLGMTGDPLSLHLYAYCRNNPLKYVDPSGHGWLDDWSKNAVESTRAAEAEGRIPSDSGKSSSKSSSNSSSSSGSGSKGNSGGSAVKGWNEPIEDYSARTGYYIGSGVGAGNVDHASDNDGNIYNTSGKTPLEVFEQGLKKNAEYNNILYDLYDARDAAQAAKNNSLTQTLTNIIDTARFDNTRYADPVEAIVRAVAQNTPAYLSATKATNQVGSVGVNQNPNTGIMPNPALNPYDDPFLGESLRVKDAFKYDWKGEHVTFEFSAKVMVICEELGISPDDLMTVMAAESKFNPGQWNLEGYRAVGLIQFTDVTSVYTGTTLEELAGMSGVEQLDSVYKYLAACEKMYGDISDIADIYTATFAPAKLKISDDNAVLYSKGEWEYDANKPLDRNGDGDITRKEIMEHLYDQTKGFR